MTKTPMTCPFSSKGCKECAVYRGRHHYLTFRKEHDPQKGNGQFRDHSLALDFQALKNAVKPVAERNDEKRTEPAIRLKIIDMESRASRICELNELKRWDWSSPRIWRLIDGRQVTSLDSLIEILCYKAEKGFKEVELYEAPRFMMLAGG